MSSDEKIEEDGIQAQGKGNRASKDEVSYTSGDVDGVPSAPGFAFVLPARLRRPLHLGPICVFELVDIVIWAFVMVFFLASAVLQGGELLPSFLGACGVIVIMFVVGVSIEVIIETLKNIKGLGTIVGFITNGPEALCLIVGLVTGDVLFAASTPLGSNFMNPLLLFFAAALTASFLLTLKTSPGYLATCVGLTAAIAVSLFFIDHSIYLYWVVVALVVSGTLFFMRPAEPELEDGDEISLRRSWFIPAATLLVAAGYFLDPVVNYTAQYARAPKGMIGFFALSALTSWPEFKSCLSLFRRRRPLAAVLNITVSNITNLWLAIIGVTLYLILSGL